MFKTITKIGAVIAILAVVLTMASSALASSGWNDSSQGQDCPTVTVARNGNAPTTGYGCWNTSDTASVGDNITFAIYYHNTSSQSASGVSIYLENPGTSTQNAFTLSGGIMVNGQTVSTGSATINLDSGATLVPVQATNELNGGVNDQSVPVSQILTSNGYTIGTVGTGWAEQGVVKVEFSVIAGNTCTNCNATGQEPSVTTNIASNLDSNNGNVTLNGYFNSNGSATTTSFQYQDNGGSWINVGSSSQGISSGNYNYNLTGLAGGSYTYEAVATNSYGTVYGSPMTFTIYGSNNNTQYCPSGYYGTYPNCYPINNTQYCPSGTTGTYPNCYPINNQVCPINTTGYYPNCVPIVQTCQPGYVWNGSTCIYQQPIVTNSLPSISTLDTISVGGTVAVVDGYYSSNSCSVNTYFNYGTTQSLGQTTGIVSRGIGSGSMAQALQNLNPNTTYYYQAVGQNCSGTATGSIQSFTTSGTTVHDTTITHYVSTITNTGGSGGNSFIDLTIDNHRDVVDQGVQTDYDVTWTNLTSTDLKNLVLEINFPSQMTITNTDRGAVEAGKSSVVYQISDLTPHETDSMTVSGVINSGMKDGDPVVAQAIMAFQNPKTNATENAIAYDADTFATAGSIAGASIFGLGFLPNTLIGWLIIILIILIIVLIARHFWNRPNQAPTNMIIHNPAPQPLAPPATVITGAPTGEYTVYQPTPKQ